MRHKQKMGVISAKSAVMMRLAIAHTLGLEQHPDVPQHPLDGPIPTD